MALSKNRYGKVSNIRAYIDLVQYAKAVGYVQEIVNWNLDGDETDGGDVFSPWDFNPTNVKRFTCNGGGGSADHVGFIIRFKNYGADTDGVYSNRLFADLLRGSNYLGIFGHELLISAGEKVSHVNFYASGRTDADVATSSWAGEGSSASSFYSSGIVGEYNAPGLGYTLIGFDGWNDTDHQNFEGFKVVIWADASTLFDDGSVSGNSPDFFDIGCISIGRHMDFPHSTEVDVNISYSYEGIKSKHTTGGSTLTKFDYYKRPDWGDFPSWFHHYSVPGAVTGNWWKEYNVKQVGQNGRRIFNLKWSYLDKKDVFSQWSEHSQAAMYGTGNTSPSATDITYFYDGTEHRETIISTLMNFTLGGQIPFILQLDAGSGGDNPHVHTDAQQDFAFVKIDQKSISVKQVANGVYDMSLKLIEVW